MKTTIGEDGTVTTSLTFVDYYIDQLKQARACLDESIERLEHIDRDIRPDGLVAARAYIPFNAEQASSFMRGAHELLVNAMVDFSAAQALFTPAHGTRHGAAERVREQVEDAKRHERGEDSDASSLKNQVLDALKLHGALRLPALVEIIGKEYLATHPLVNPADGHWRDGAHQHLMKRAKTMALDLIDQGVLTVGDDYKARVSESETKHNIKEGQKALARAVKSKVFTTPGVKLDLPPHVPLYRADPNEPGILIRTLHGKTERGTLTHRGKWVPKR